MRVLRFVWSMRAMASMTLDVGEVQLLIAIHTNEPPSEGEWDQYVGQALTRLERRKGSRDRHRGLVVTDGGGPNAVQRQQLVDDLNTHAQPPSVSAIITDVAEIHRIITALNWFGGRNRCFVPNDAAAAMAHVGVRSEDYRSISDALVALQSELPEVRCLTAALHVLALRREG